MIDFYQKSFFIEFLDNFFARFFNRQTGKFSGNRQEFAAFVDDLLVIKVMALRNLKVHR